MKTSFASTSLVAVVLCSSFAYAQEPAAPPAGAPPAEGATQPAVAAPVAPVATPIPAPLPPDLGDQGTFVIDQVSGFRGRLGGGVTYYGPIGLAYNQFDTVSPLAIVPSTTGQQFSISKSETTIRSWSLWFAPSIDYFVVRNISVGGLFSVDTTFGSTETRVETTQLAGTGTATINSTPSKQNLPSTTSFTLMPRVGYFFRFTDRISLWPRVGIGYFSGNNVALEASANGAQIETRTRTTNFSSLVVQFDVGFIYQVTDNLFFRAAPAVTFSSGGSSSVKYKAQPGSALGQVSDTEGQGSGFQFEIASGFGANFNL